MSHRLRSLAITILALGCAPAPEELLTPERPPLFGPQSEPQKPTHHPVADSRFGALWSDKDVDAFAASIRDQSGSQR